MFTSTLHSLAIAERFQRSTYCDEQSPTNSHHQVDKSSRVQKILHANGSNQLAACPVHLVEYLRNVSNLLQPPDYEATGSRAYESGDTDIKVVRRDSALEHSVYSTPAKLLRGITNVMLNCGG